MKLGVCSWHFVIHDLVCADMALEQEAKVDSKIARCDAYFETVQSRKKLPYSLQETLTTAFARIPVSSFPEVPGGKGEIIKSHCLLFTLFCG